MSQNCVGQASATLCVGFQQEKAVAHHDVWNLVDIQSWELLILRASMTVASSSGSALT